MSHNASAAPVLSFEPRPVAAPLILTQNTGTGGSNGGGATGGESRGSDSNNDGGTVRGSQSSSASRTPPIATSQTEANNVTTQTITRRLEDADDHCGRLGREYRPDCLAQEFRDLADALPRRGDYAEARAAIDRVARELEGIARSARDRQKARLRLQVQRAGEQGRRNTRPISAVRDPQLASATQQAAQAVERGKLLLLRSAPPGDPRRVHYQRIANAFDDSAILLRS